MVIYITILMANGIIYFITKKADYEFREKASTSDRLFFRKDYLHKNKKRRIHIHLTEYNSKNWKGMVAFCDYLKENYKVAEKYARIKREGIKITCDDGKIYRKHYIENIRRNLLKIF